MEVKKEGTKEEISSKTEEIKEKKEIPMRRIVILTDGNSIHLESAEVSGKIELVAILEGLLNFLRNQK